MPVKRGWFIAISYLLILVLLWAAQNFANDLFEIATQNEALGDYASTYESRSTEKMTAKFGLGFFLNLIPFLLTLRILVQKKSSNSIENKHLVSLAAITYLIYPFMIILPLVSRISYYFGVYQIIAMPILYASVKNQILRIGLIAFFVLTTLLTYFNFFYDEIWIEKYSEFQTILPLIW